MMAFISAMLPDAARYAIIMPRLRFLIITRAAAVSHAGAMAGQKRQSRRYSMAGMVVWWRWQATGGRVVPRRRKVGKNRNGSWRVQAGCKKAVLHACHAVEKSARGRRGTRRQRTVRNGNGARGSGRKYRCAVEGSG